MLDVWLHPECISVFGSLRLVPLSQLPLTCSNLTIKTLEQRWHRLKFNNKGTRTPMASFWCLYFQLWTYSTAWSSVFTFNFEHVITGWNRYGIKRGTDLTYFKSTFYQRISTGCKMKRSFLISSNLKPLVSLQDIIWLQYEVPDRVKAMRK